RAPSLSPILMRCSPLSTLFPYTTLFRSKLRFQGVFRTLYFLPSVVPAVAAALLWRWFLNPDYGPVNEFLWQLGINGPGWLADPRSEEHTSELQSRENLVCRLLLEKKKVS